MEPPRDDRLSDDLRALRPTPRPRFAAELDQRAAAGFPRRSRLPRLPFGRLRAVPPRRLLASAGAAAFASIALATVLVIGNQGGSNPSTNLNPHRATRGGSQNFDDSGRSIKPAPEVERLSRVEGLSSGASAAGRANSKRAELVPFDHNASSNLRAVERSAELVLAAGPADVAADSAKVFEAVHAQGGIVMRSSTREGEAGEAGASFDLLIPSRKLADAMAAFSQIDAVRSRHEATADITAPTRSASGLLRQSRARIDSLLAQLGAAESEEERLPIEAELRHERRRASRLAIRLAHLHRRAGFSRVSLRIETGSAGGASGGAWSIDDGLRSAGRVLAVAAGVTLVGLAILAPIALIALLAWLSHRAWVQRERRRALN